MRRVLRSALGLLAAFVIGGALVAVAPSPVGAAGRHTTAHATHAKKHKKHKKRKKPPRPVTLAPGAVARYYDVTIGPKHVVRSTLLRFDLRNPRLRVGASVPLNAIGAGRQQLLTQARLGRAVGGINADFYDINSRRGDPKGGLVIGQTLYKSPRRDFDANLYIRSGRATIGRLNMIAGVTRDARPAVPESTDLDGNTVPAVPAAPARSRTISAVNSIRDLDGDRIVLLTTALAYPVFGRSCNAAVGVRTATGGQVTAVYGGVTSISRRAPGEFALVACGTGARATWLADQVAVGDTLQLVTTFDGGMPATLVSGGRVLVARGRAYNDADGKTIRGRNPEAFGCVSASGYGMLFGTIDGRREGSSGVTLAELTRYLLGLRCWSAIVFDGGGSATLVGRKLGTGAVRLLNRPSDLSGARPVTSGLLIYRR